jgi:hypothetical protein
MNSQYFIRIRTEDDSAFSSYIEKYDLRHTILSRDANTNLYSISLSDDDFLALRLSFQLNGFMNFGQEVNDEFLTRLPELTQE